MGMASSSPTREPLLSTTNESSSPSRTSIDFITTSPQTEFPSKRAIREYCLRRKAAVQYLPHLDSSESYPSYHSSLYDASVDDSSNARPAFFKNSIALQAPTLTKPVPTTKNTLSAPSSPRAHLLDTHIPHALYPIIEQHSHSTLNTANSNTSLGPPRHRKSFSLPNLPIPKTRYTSPSTPLNPPHSPPHRAPTPPNLPSFGRPEACTYRLPPPPPPPSEAHTSSAKRFFAKRFRSPPPEVLEWRHQTQGLPRGTAIMRGEDGTLLKGRFVPGLSGHLGPGRGMGAFGPGIGGLVERNDGSVRGRGAAGGGDGGGREIGAGRRGQRQPATNIDGVVSGNGRVSRTRGKSLGWWSWLWGSGRGRGSSRADRRRRRRRQGCAVDGWWVELCGCCR